MDGLVSRGLLICSFFCDFVHGAWCLVRFSLDFQPLSRNRRVIITYYRKNDHSNAFCTNQHSTYRSFKHALLRVSCFRRFKQLLPQGLLKSTNRTSSFKHSESKQLTPSLFSFYSLTTLTLGSFPTSLSSQVSSIKISSF